MQSEIYIPLLDIKEIGTVLEAKNGIVTVVGLTNCFFGQEVSFGEGIKGMVIGFSETYAYCIVFDVGDSVSVGRMVSALTELINVPVGDNFIGRVVSSLGEPVDNKEPIEASDNLPVFKQAPGIMDRIPLFECAATRIAHCPQASGSSVWR